MIDIRTDHIYNTILSIAFGVLIVLFIDQLFVRPVVISIDRSK